jgi:hypothetical protein
MIEIKKQKIDKNIKIPTDPMEVLNLSEILLESLPPNEAISVLFASKVEYIDFELRQRNISGSHFQREFERIVHDDRVSEAYDSGVNSNVFERVSKGHLTVAFPGDFMDRNEQEEEKRKRFFTHDMFRSLAAEVSGNDAEFETFISDMLSSKILRLI